MNPIHTSNTKKHNKIQRDERSEGTKQKKNKTKGSERLFDQFFVFDARFLNVHFPPVPPSRKSNFLFFIIILFGQTPDFILSSCYILMLFTPQKTIVSFVCLFVCCFVLGQNKKKIIGTTTHSQFYDFLQLNVNVKKTNF